MICFTLCPGITKNPLKMWILIGYQYAYIHFLNQFFLFGHLLIKYIELLSFELKIESCNPCIYSFYKHWGDRFIKKIGLLNLQLRNCIILSHLVCSWDYCINHEKSALAAYVFFLQCLQTSYPVKSILLFIFTYNIQYERHSLNYCYHRLI